MKINFRAVLFLTKIRKLAVFVVQCLVTFECLNFAENF